MSEVQKPYELGWKLKDLTNSERVSLSVFLKELWPISLWEKFQVKSWLSILCTDWSWNDLYDRPIWDEDIPNYKITRDNLINFLLMALDKKGWVIIELRNKIIKLNLITEIGDLQDEVSSNIKSTLDDEWPWITWC